MSKRAGEFVTLRDVVDEVGRDAVRFMMLFRKNDAPLDFDLAKVIEQSKDNPVFYVQYAHARCRSVFRQAEAAFPAGLSHLAMLVAGRSRRLLSRRGRTGRDPAARPVSASVEAAAAAHEPHRVAFYLYELASDFHALWNKGKEAPHLRFVIETDQMSSYARLALVQAVMSVLASGLASWGYQPRTKCADRKGSVPVRMRNGAYVAAGRTCVINPVRARHESFDDCSLARRRTTTGASMTDQNRARPVHRPRRAGAPVARGGRSARRSGARGLRSPKEDPLAELARIVGQGRSLPLLPAAGRKRPGYAAQPLPAQPARGGSEPYAGPDEPVRGRTERPDPQWRAVRSQRSAVFRHGPARAPGRRPARRRPRLPGTRDDRSVRLRP